MIREVKRIIRNVNRSINPPQFIGATRVIKRPRNMGDAVLKKRLNSLGTIRIILFYTWVVIILVLDMIFRFLHHISGGN